MAKYQVFSRSSLWSDSPKMFCCKWWIREQGHSSGWPWLCLLSHNMNFILWGRVVTGAAPDVPDRPHCHCHECQHSRQGVAFPPKAGCYHRKHSHVCWHWWTLQKTESAYTIHCLEAAFLTFSGIMVLSAGVNQDPLQFVWGMCLLTESLQKPCSFPGCNWYAK